MEDSSAGPTIRWDVRAEHIDLDRWAHAIVKASTRNQQGDKVPVTRWGVWPLLVMWAVVLLVAGRRIALIAIPMVGVLLSTVLLANRTAARRLAKRLHDMPAASEPFTFIADATGTNDTSPTGSSKLAWTRYKAVTLDDDLIVLTMQGGAMRVLPTVGLTSGPGPEAIVDQIGAWITQAAS